jgi:hypothetical protein
VHSGDARIAVFFGFSATEPLVKSDVLTTGATGPALRAERPAVIHYAVDSTGTHYWITGTGLPSAVASSAIVLPQSQTEGGPPTVIEGKLEPSAPTTEPASKK